MQPLLAAVANSLSARAEKVSGLFAPTQCTYVVLCRLLSGRVRKGLPAADGADRWHLRRSLPFIGLPHSRRGAQRPRERKHQREEHLVGRNDLGVLQQLPWTCVHVARGVQDVDSIEASNGHPLIGLPNAGARQGTFLSAAVQQRCDLLLPGVAIVRPLIGSEPRRRRELSAKAHGVEAGLQGNNGEAALAEKDEAAVVQAANLKAPRCCAMPAHFARPLGEQVPHRLGDLQAAPVGPMRVRQQAISHPRRLHSLRELGMHESFHSAVHAVLGLGAPVLRKPLPPERLQRQAIDHNEQQHQHARKDPRLTSILVPLLARWVSSSTSIFSQASPLHFTAFATLALEASLRQVGFPRSQGVLGSALHFFNSAFLPPILTWRSLSRISRSGFCPLRQLEGQSGPRGTLAQQLATPGEHLSIALRQAPRPHPGHRSGEERGEGERSGVPA
eukprot:scaffold24_cov245-Pinguiococcus_pyrenoidosus.AAC.18